MPAQPTLDPPSGPPGRNPVLCSSALTRLVWAAAALISLWTTVLWALY
ncbi:hypothetical protein [Accumulibacter sp.]|nr:hypothetical protein [Accumulibacter sp.]MCM8596003.1 hypothetical protein [Accumulibacter sp.]MCM8626659.1 hypothetical protein [Accumulibacter sp.]MDS4050152.1 hypothetical protein [Accumulibacter sp.]